MKILRAIACATLLIAGDKPAFASVVMLGPVNLGSATTQTILSVQNVGTASGCVGFFAGADVTGLGACPGGFTGSGGNELIPDAATSTVGQLQSMGVHDAANLLLVFHPGEPAGTSLDLTDLALVFFDNAAGTSFTAALPSTPFAITTTAPGGANAGIAFKLDAFEASLANEFMSNTDNRVGVDATISGSTGAVDSFFVGAQAPTSAVPEPSVLWLAGIGLLALYWLRLGTHEQVSEVECYRRRLRPIPLDSPFLRRRRRIAPLMAHTMYRRRGIRNSLWPNAGSPGILPNIGPSSWPPTVGAKTTTTAVAACPSGHWSHFANSSCA